MRTVLIGSVEFTRACLVAMVRTGHPPCAIFAPAVTPAGTDRVDLAADAETHRIPLVRFKKISDEVESLRRLEPDLVCVFGLSQLLSRELLAVPRIGCLGSHPAALPRNRGRHPLIWAIANGLTESALSFLWLTEEADAGDLWAQRPFAISPDDDARTVYDRICALAGEVIGERLPRLAAGVVDRAPQDRSLANVWRKRTAADGRVDWRMSNKRIRDLVRALTRPYPGATTLWRGSDIPLWRVEALPSDGTDHLEPGKVVAVDGRAPVVRSGDGRIRILDHGFAPEALPRPGDYIG